MTLSTLIPRTSLAVIVLLSLTAAPAVGQTLDIVWIVDRTAGMASETAALRSSYLALISDFQSSSCIDQLLLRQGLVVFDETSEVISELTEDVSAFNAALAGFPSSMGTLENGAAAISTASTLSFEPSSEKHFVLLTDEPGDWSPAEQSDAVLALTEQGITLWVIYGDANLAPVQSTYGQIQLQSGSVDPMGDPLLFSGPDAAAATAAQAVLSEIAVGVTCYATEVQTSYPTIPGMTCGFFISQFDSLGRTVQLDQSWDSLSFDFSSLVVGNSVGGATQNDLGQRFMELEITVASVTANTAAFDFTVTEISSELLNEVVLLGGTDPTGTVVGSMLLSDISGPTVTLVHPDPFPPGSQWLPGSPWETGVQVCAPVVSLPFGPSLITIDSTSTGVDGTTLDQTQVIAIAQPSPDYLATYSTALSSTSVGATALIGQTITDPPGDRLTLSAETLFSDGAFDLSGYMAGDTCGSMVIEDGTFPQAILATLEVTTVAADEIGAAAIVTAVDPTLLALWLSLGLPDPTGATIFTLSYRNLVGGGARLDVENGSLLPPGAPIILTTPFVTALQHDIGLVLPGAEGDLIVQALLQNQFAEYAFSSETFIVTASTNPQFERGDCNADGAYDIADAIITLDALFGGGTTIPLCLDACDSNDDGGNDIADAIFTLGALFSGGPSPGAPHGACGEDPSADGLDCGSFPACP